MANMDLKQTVAAVTSSVALVVPRKIERNYLCIQNVGSNDLTFGFDNTITSGNGTVLSPGGLGKQGGFFIWEKNFIPANPIYAISAAGSTIIVLEG